MCNTEIYYLYRDAGNYKKGNTVVIEGTFSEEQIRTIMECLNEEEYFIPKQVGLPEERFSKWTPDDHCWFELSREGFRKTEAAATVAITAEELVSNFIKAKGAWRDWE